jgi:hypothetical protein
VVVLVVVELISRVAYSNQKDQVLFVQFGFAET